MAQCHYKWHSATINGTVPLYRAPWTMRIAPWRAGGGTMKKAPWENMDFPFTHVAIPFTHRTFPISTWTSPWHTTRSVVDIPFTHVSMAQSRGAPWQTHHENTWVFPWHTWTYPAHTDYHGHSQGRCNTLQHTATHCNTLQHTATTHCNTLQHTATHCNTLHFRLNLQLH